MSTPPRFLLDDGVLQRLATIDSSYGECALDGRLAVFVDYRRGVPMSIQLVKMPTAISLKVHMSVTDSA